MRLDHYDYCECGCLKIKRSFQCRKCTGLSQRKERLPKAKRVKKAKALIMYDTCKCGDQKRKTSKQCSSCYRETLSQSTGPNYIDGRSGTLEYSAYMNMLRRCGYSGSTIKEGYEFIEVCERWRLSYTNFLEDIGATPGPGYDLDRIESSGNYEKDNCQWLEHEEHTRKSTIERERRKHACLCD